MIVEIPAVNRITERPQALTAPIRSLPFIPSDFSTTVSPAGTIVEMQAVVTIKTRMDAVQPQTRQQMLEVLA